MNIYIMGRQIILAGSLVLCGCTPSVIGAPELGSYKKTSSDYFAGRFNGNKMSQYDTTVDELTRQRLRNSIILSAIGSIDLQYSAFVGRLTQEGQIFPFAATITSLSLSGAGTLVGSAAAKTTLAAVDTGIKGGVAAYDKNVLAERTIPSIQKQMQASRNEVRSSIFSKLGESTATYPLELALLDVNDYAAAGTITAGLAGIDEQASKNLQATETEKVTEIYPYGADNATVEIRRFIDSGNRAVQLAVDEAVKKEGTNLVRFLNDPRYAEARRKLLSVLKNLKPG